MARWIARIKMFLRGHSRAEAEGGTHDLDQKSQFLLSMLSSSVVVVDADGQVVRSSPDAYRLAIVNQDRIDNPTVQEAVRKAWLSDEVARFSLVTHTPTDIADELTIGGSRVNVDGEQNQDLIDAEGSSSGVSRPNWLKLTVGRISEDLVLVLIDDESESKRFEQTRQGFVEHVSQQLLQPVAALKQLAFGLDTIASEPIDNLSQQRERMEAIAQDAQELSGYSAYLEHTLNDLLLLMRAQEQVEPNADNELDLGEQVEAVIEAAEGKAEQAHVQLNYSGQPGLYLHGDQEQIQAAMRKLVENAIRYSPARGNVTLVAKRSKDANYGMVQVIDRGEGIAKDEQEHVFERFYRGSLQTDSSEVGVGLGLAIAKHVALTHHGSLSLWSAPGQGSTFTLILPLAEEETKETTINSEV
ncbi:hypothetical protein KIMH_11700 [Bombiscardovia apis]|uniref:Sensor-like histidine kinase SenX3 n=1 Tax=Bombiscardovia apis TaxID=2932182 RepID=A0ABM8BDS5_9BIFI|nr:ATP-binding protein [Bombiscardovia apis]BDR55059.1 hypothetical protein KIMH_11700 [Bombiscardovia apis]